MAWGCGRRAFASRDDGAALVLALMVSALLAALGLSVLVVSDIERRIAANAHWSSEAAAAAEAAVERAIVDLRQMPDWSLALSGGVTSVFSEQARQVALPAGGTLDLDAVTAELQDELESAGTFGPDTPAWRLFAWGPMAGLAEPGAVESAQYLAVWIADDPSDADGQPAIDANGTVVVHGEARGPGGARRGVEATVSRSATGAVRVRTWREVQ